MKSELQQYRFARLEAHKITYARLQSQFKDGIHDLESFENTIAQQLTTELPNCIPWRTSEVEQVAGREGSRLATLEFYWTQHQELRLGALCAARATTSLAS